MRVLVICDDRWHPASVVRDGVAPLEDEGLEFDWIEDADEWSAAKMADYPVVLMAKSNNVSEGDEAEMWMTPEVEAGFREYVENGGGLLVVHSGTAGYKETPVYRALMGGVFESHPPQCSVTVEPDPDHPVAQGVTPFTVKDEHYQMVIDDEDAGIFVTTTSEHGTQPGAWIRIEGDGRVGVLTPGHNLEVWLHPSFQTLLENMLRWCSHS